VAALVSQFESVKYGPIMHYIYIYIYIYITTTHRLLQYGVNYVVVLHAELRQTRQSISSVRVAVTYLLGSLVFAHSLTIKQETNRVGVNCLA
jgi:hypothetical protein